MTPHKVGTPRSRRLRAGLRALRVRGCCDPRPVRFGLFYEHQLPRPWEPGAERRLLADALDQVELADRVGFDCVWEVEHHFLEEYSHSSAPEVFLAAASQRTERIRLGHGIVQAIPEINHPARIAERVATLDLISGGRVEFGTGEGASQLELGGFGVDRFRKHEIWSDTLDALTRMFVEEPFCGWDSDSFQMPPRNVVPKPEQKPHPPLWVACSRRESILDAARRGLGALCFSFVEPEEAGEWVSEYYRLLESDECVPSGFEWNPNVAVVLPFMVHPDERTALERGSDGANFFGFSLGYYYGFGSHLPGHSDVWEEFGRRRAEFGFAELADPADAPLGVRIMQQSLGSLRGAIGTPDQVRSLLERYEAVGVDQVIFVGQAGRNRHEHICEAIELFAQDVMPPFAEQAASREQAKRERLAPARERALARRSAPRQLDAPYRVLPHAEPRAAELLRAARRFEGNGARSLGERAEDLGKGVFAALVRGRSDRQLERTIGSGAGMRAFFAGMARQFTPERSNGFEGDLQWELSGGGSTRIVHIRVRDARAAARTGAAADPAVTIRMPLAEFVRIAAEIEPPAKALMEGRMEIEGDLQTAWRIGEMFGGPPQS